jgi:acyl-CoA thioester hydrolase
MNKSKVFSLPVRVYYQDTDAGGVVYHANYVNFMERARTEWLRDLGYSHMDMIRNLDVMFVVRSIKLDYLRPAVLDDLLQVSAKIKEVGRSRVTLEQMVMRGDEVLAEGEVHLVCVAVQTFKPVSVPEILRKQWN